MNLDFLTEQFAQCGGQGGSSPAPTAPHNGSVVGGREGSISEQPNLREEITGLEVTGFTGYVHPSPLTPEYTKRVMTAIELTMPESKDTDDKDTALFEFDGRFKLLVPDATECEQKAAAVAWHHVAWSRGLLEDNESEQTWFEFEQAWPDAFTYEKRNPFNEYLARVREDATAIPARAAIYEQLRFRDFIGAIALMQRSRGDEPIWVTVDNAAKSLKMSPNSVNKWFGQPSKKRPGRLVKDKWIEIVDPGRQALPKTKDHDALPGRVRKFRYIGPQPILRGHRVPIVQGGVQ